MKDVIHQRRLTNSVEERKNISKAILKLSRQELRAWRSTWSEHLLTKMRNTKYLQKVYIDPIHSAACPVDPDDFADFLGNIFDGPNANAADIDMDSLSTIPRFPLDELKTALSQLSNLRCGDADGMISEMFKYGSGALQMHLLNCFNDILHSYHFDEKWNHSLFHMLPKDGGSRLLF